MLSACHANTKVVDNNTQMHEYNSDNLHTPSDYTPEAIIYTNRFEVHTVTSYPIYLVCLVVPLDPLHPARHPLQTCP